MLQLSKNQPTNTIAFYPNVLPTAGNGLYVEYTQSYNKNSGSFSGTILSNPQNTPWVVAQISGSVLPSASGQYVFNSYELILSGSAIWNLYIVQWQAATDTWDNAGGQSLGDLISIDRAWISGSDVEPITQYLSPNEDAYYTTYLG